MDSPDCEAFFILDEIEHLDVSSDRTRPTFDREIETHTLG